MLDTFLLIIVLTGLLCCMARVACRTIPKSAPLRFVVGCFHLGGQHSCQGRRSLPALLLTSPQVRLVRREPSRKEGMEDVPLSMLAAKHRPGPPLRQGDHVLQLNPTSIEAQRGGF